MKNKRLTGPITESLEEGQRYVDEAVKKIVPVYCGKEPMNGHVVRYYKRIPLRWMKPGPDGKLIPRDVFSDIDPENLALNN